MIFWFFCFMVLLPTILGYYWGWTGAIIGTLLSGLFTYLMYKRYMLTVEVSDYGVKVFRNGEVIRDFPKQKYTFSTFIQKSLYFGITILTNNMIIATDKESGKQKNVSTFCFTKDDFDVLATNIFQLNDEQESNN